MVRWDWKQCVVVGTILGLFSWAGCNKPSGVDSGAGAKSTPASDGVKAQAAPKAKTPATADSGDVKAARERIDGLGKRAKYAPKEGDLLSEIVIQDGSNLKAEDLAIFGKLSDLEKLQIFNCRTLNDEMAATLGNLKGLKTLAIPRFK